MKLTEGVVEWIHAQRIWENRGILNLPLERSYGKVHETTIIS